MIALRFAVPFAALVLAPLGLWIAGGAVRDIGGLLATGLLLVASLVLEPGIPAMLGTVPFAVAAIWLAGRQRRRTPFLYLAGGTAALALARGEWAISGFPEALLLLTAIHAYYAGFAACLFTECTARELGQRAATTWFRLPAKTVVWAPLALTAAIPASTYLEAAVSLAQALALTVVSGLALVATTGSKQPLRAVGLSIAAACAVIGMAASAIFAASRLGNLYWLPTPQLGAVHAVAMGAGFSFAGLVSWMGQRDQVDHTRSGASSRMPA